MLVPRRHTSPLADKMAAISRKIVAAIERRFDADKRVGRFDEHNEETKNRNKLKNTMRTLKHFFIFLCAVLAISWVSLYGNSATRSRLLIIINI